MKKRESTKDARDIAIPTLVVREELDFWSRPAAAATLATERVNALVVQTVTIPAVTHYLLIAQSGGDRSSLKKC